MLNLLVHHVTSRLSKVNWDASLPAMQKIRIIGFFFEKISYIGILKFSCYYLQHVPASKPAEHACFAVLEAITLYCT